MFCKSLQAHPPVITFPQSIITTMAITMFTNTLKLEFPQAKLLTSTLYSTKPTNFKLPNFSDMRAYKITFKLMITFFTTEKTGQTVNSKPSWKFLLLILGGILSHLILARLKTLRYLLNLIVGETSYQVAILHIRRNVRKLSICIKGF